MYSWLNINDHSKFRPSHGVPFTDQSSTISCNTDNRLNMIFGPILAESKFWTSTLKFLRTDKRQLILYSTSPRIKVHEGVAKYCYCSHFQLVPEIRKKNCVIGYDRRTNIALLRIDSIIVEISMIRSLNRKMYSDNFLLAISVNL